MKQQHRGELTEVFAYLVFLLLCELIPLRAFIEVSISSGEPAKDRVCKILAGLLNELLNLVSWPGGFNTHFVVDGG